MKGFVISVLVGGVFLVSVILLKNSMVQHSIDSVYDISIKNDIETIRLLLSNDMQYVGYGRSAEIIEIHDSVLTFRAEILPGDFLQISWELTDDVPSGVSNPDLRTLVRNGPMYDGTADVFESTFLVSRFDIAAFMDAQGIYPVTNCENGHNSCNNIRSILVEVDVETAEAVGSGPGGEARYPGANWSRLFRPRNLNLDN
ncbi:hypothetical protein QLX67_02535 [Balneolaceae bacterium ANBcel3]|nr:hypothetical protein [Balneolaceae bacterium ANBcel3]